MMMALNTETEECDNDGSERQNWKCDEDGSKRRNRKYDEDASKHRYWEVITMALDAERRCDDGSECRNRERNSECQTRK